MKKSFFAILFFCTILTKQSTSLISKTQQDLDFIYTTILENHPGIYNTLDPNFKDNLDYFYKQAQKSLNSIQTTDQAKTVLTLFAKQFNDAHLWVHFNNEEKKQDLTREKSTEFNITKITNQIVWATIPTFELNHEQQKTFNNIVKTLPQYNDKKAIVFDLRNNRGGNSSYGNQLTDALFSKEYTDHKRKKAHASVAVDWRVSAGNIEHMHKLFERYKSLWIQKTANHMAQSLALNQPYFHATATPTSDTENTSIPTPPHLSTLKVIVIIDAGNVSAALDFIDDLKIAQSDVTLIGQKTKADRLYMGVRTESLPSNLGTFSFPIKVYRNRFRKDNEPYIPDIVSDTSNTEALQKTIIDFVK